MGMRQDQCALLPADESKDLRQDGRSPFRVSVRATIYPPPGDEARAARICHLLTQDVSESGIGIVYARPLRVGQRIALELPDGCRSVVVCGIRILSDGRYLVGCRFDEAAIDGQSFTA